MSEACVCVHAHLYQPPRENPWLEEVEPQPSAAPFHDWNGRITAECYGPNAAARLLDAEDRIVGIRNNYGSISFNFGPTLLSWMERHRRDTYEAILEADRESLSRFGGHGSALAQSYHHTILPLASPRDRRTEVKWGVADFRSRFGRAPEGMWLPETAVCLDTLEALAENGIRFTILAPHQAGRTRRRGAESWEDVEGAEVDTRVAYLQRLPSGREIALFFYDGGTSTAVAFEKLLDDGAALAARLASIAREGQGPRLAHIATDGETYGHHHAQGEMALAEALRRWEADPDLRLINYGQFLAEHPPEHEVEIREFTSWSCAHGVERWRSDCGCSSGGYPDWNQSWRQPLRSSLDHLAAELAEEYERQAKSVLGDPWDARDAYIEVLLDPRPESRKRFLERYLAAGARVAEEPERVFRLLELQRHALLMFTSCGWFFDDLGGLETRQVLAYTARALELAEGLGAGHVREPFLEQVSRARANGPDGLDGRQLIEAETLRTRVTPSDLAVAHAAAVTTGSDLTATGAWRMGGRKVSVASPGARSAAGDVEVTSRRTGESWTYRYEGLAVHGQARIRVTPVHPSSPAAPGREVSDVADLRPDVRELVETGLTRIASETAGPTPAGGLGGALRACAAGPGQPDLAAQALEVLVGPRAEVTDRTVEGVDAGLERALVAQLEELAAGESARASNLLATVYLLLDVADAAGIAVDTPRIQNRWWQVVASAEALDPDMVRDIGRRLRFSESAGHASRQEAEPASRGP